MIFFGKENVKIKARSSGFSISFNENNANLLIFESKLKKNKSNPKINSNIPVVQWPTSHGHINKMLTNCNTNLTILVKMSGQPASLEQWFRRCEYDYSAPLVYIWLKSYFLFTSVLDHLECVQGLYNLWVIKSQTLCFQGSLPLKVLGSCKLAHQSH